MCNIVLHVKVRQKEHCDQPELRLGQVEGFYILEISTKMRLATHTHGSDIPWNTLNLIFCYFRS